MKSRDEIMKSLMCRVRGCLEKCDHRCDMCELYVPNYRLEDRYADAHAYIQQLEERNSKLEYTLLGVMHSVDKWLDVEPYDFDKDDGTVAATRASNAREIALKAIEKAQADLAQVERERNAAVAEIKRMEGKAKELLETEIHDVIHRELPSSYYLDFILQVDQICNYQFENEWRGGFEKNTKGSSE